MMSKEVKKEVPVADERLAVLQDLANRVARSTVAVIDTVVQRGGFKGEELTTIAQLRDQAIQVVALYEAVAKQFAEEEAETSDSESQEK